MSGLDFIKGEESASSLKESVVIGTDSFKQMNARLLALESN